MRNRVWKKKILVGLGLAVTLLAGACNPSRETKQTTELPEERKIVVGFSQVGAESDWRSANTESMKSALSAENRVVNGLAGGEGCGNSGHYC